MEFQDVLTISGTILATLGGGTVIVFAFSSWLGNIWATRIADKEKQAFQIRFDSIQSDNNRLLDALKHAKQRYSSKQFELYNELWHSLIELKTSADNLWIEVGRGKLKEFISKVKKASIAIDKNALLIEDEHYEKLIIIMKEFEEFQFGKQKLIDLYSKNIDMQEFSEEDIKYTISRNECTKEQYTSFLNEIRTHFKKQIRGENDI